jgi:quaternary ammonium compound-resistance protein SugE
MSWLILGIAGVFECVGAVGLKSSDGFRNRRWTIIFVLGMFVSMFLLAVATREIPIGTAYAVWTGIGAVGTAIWGMHRLGESKSWRRIACLSLIVLGVVTLRSTESEAGPPPAVWSEADDGQPLDADH